MPSGTPGIPIRAPILSATGNRGKLCSSNAAWLRTAFDQSSTSALGQKPSVPRGNALRSFDLFLCECDCRRILPAEEKRHRRRSNCPQPHLSRFWRLSEGPCSFCGPDQERAPRPFSRILCGYFQHGNVGSFCVIISLSSPDFEGSSGPRMVHAFLENVVVQHSDDSVPGHDVCVSSALGGAKLFSFASNAFRGAMLNVDAELGYGLAGNSNLRRLRGASAAAFSIKIVSSSARCLESASIGLLASVLLAPGIFAFQQGSAFGTWRTPVQLIHHLPAAHPENMGK